MCATCVCTCMYVHASAYGKGCHFDLIFWGQDMLEVFPGHPLWGTSVSGYDQSDHFKSETLYGVWTGFK